MGFRLQQKSMTLNDPKRQFAALSLVLCVLLPTERLKLELHGFHYKLPLHLSYLQIKSEDEI